MRSLQHGRSYLTTLPGSQEELDDIKEAYLDGEGDLEHIMAHIPHSTYDDEPRIISLVKKLIKSIHCWDTQ